MVLNLMRIFIRQFQAKNQLHRKQLSKWCLANLVNAVILIVILAEKQILLNNVAISATVANFVRTRMPTQNITDDIEEEDEEGEDSD